MPVLPHVIIYTDGACIPNPGSGGWAALLRFGAHEKVLTGSAPATTNNRMEITAAIEALKTLNRTCQVDIYTDSEYLKRGITEWLPNWRRRGWKRKSGALANIDLWRELDAALSSHAITWHWVRGHAGEKDNERVDQLANAAIGTA
jgi:ribonuclease HI